MEIKYFVPIDIMHRTQEFLISQGKKDKEAFVLWKGQQQSAGTYTVTGFLIPEQKAIKSAFGYAFDISQESIARVMETLRKTNEFGLIQVHSHPGRSSLHSERDDKLSLLGRKGALSIVLPFFGNIQFVDFSQVSVHKLIGINKWELLSLEEVKKTLFIKG